MADQSTDTVHPIASAFTTSGASGLYDRARPSYPATALTRIFAALRTSLDARSSSATTGANIIELGAGSGILSRLLIHPPSTVDTHKISISTLLAVEPSSGMRASFHQGFQSLDTPVGETGVTDSETVQVLPGTFADIPAPDNWADAIIIAQAFHWSHGHYDAAIREFARVLRPNAPLILLWNLEDRTLPAHSWVGPIRDVYEAFEAGSPQYRLGLWRAAFELPEFIDTFARGREYTEVKWTMPTTVEEVVQRVKSKSYITALGEAERRTVEEKVRAAVGASVEEKGVVWIDEAGGVFEYPYATDLYVFWRK
ncbi:hypothetical protein DRE_04624 [Drechslerella stenobrocha 248]|uniref:Methyltransferase type 11 domain-containing protein n=1 Tax=Drechslerella stenobrocha 248 TaxID=1043628 RepID=W7IAH6_9PEZI|nr:hypothetical protein DRE_04624 [Drechslerella stenobrocha 248]